MAASVDGHAHDVIGSEQRILLRSIAEQLKMPLIYIARQAELNRVEGAVSADVLADMQAYADTALRLVDSYVLGLEATNNQRLQLELEPMPLSATLYDIAHDLTPLAKQRNTRIELSLAGKYGPVMANQRGFKAALYSLGTVLSEATEHADDSPAILRIAAHRTPHGIVAGIYIDGLRPINTSMEYAQKLHDKKARRSFTGLRAATGAGVFIADSIFSAMETKLRVSQYRGSTGLAVTLQPSIQLQLI